MEIKTVGEIKRSENMPENSTYASMNKIDEKQGFYRIENIKYNDGTNADCLMYFSFLSCTWVHSCNDIRDMILKRIVD